MDERVEQLSQTILQRSNGFDRSSRLLVGVSGIPGSGKSSLAYPLAERLNKLISEADGAAAVQAAICIGVDGWHYSQAELRAMPDCAHLFARRGAHFTFNAPSYLSFITQLSRPLDDTPLPYPSFSHADKDPIMHAAQRVGSHHRIIIIEGLHCFLDVEEWGTAARLLHERIWVDVPRDVARERLIRRHLTDEVEATWEAAARRVDQSDLLNADFLVANTLFPTVVLPSIELPPTVRIRPEDAPTHRNSHEAAGGDLLGPNNPLNVVYARA